jgi:hypothetical protein
MCRRILCEKCQKPSFAGCGKHVEQVLRGVPELERCHCRAQERGASAQRSSAEPQRAHAH